MAERVEKRNQSSNPHLKRIEVLAYILDGYITVPGTTFKIGLDPIIGLFPGIGDIVGGCASLYLVYLAARAGLPRRALLRMIRNVLIDIVVGAVPVLGDLFDFTWKVNLRNLAIIDQYRGRETEPRHRSIEDVSRLVLSLILILVVGLLVGLGLIVWGVVSLLRHAP